MRILKTAWFVRFAHGENISDDLLREAVRKAERGQIDAPDEVAQFKRMAIQVLALTDMQLTTLIAHGEFEEVSFSD